MQFRRRFRAVARVTAIGAALLAVGALFQWGNRWYVSTMFEAAGDPLGGQLLQSAHGSLVNALLFIVIALAAATIGWRLRVVRRGP